MNRWLSDRLDRPLLHGLVLAATLLLAPALRASLIEVAESGAAPSPWSTVERFGNTVVLYGAFNTEGWNGYVVVDNQTGSALSGELVLQLFQAGTGGLLSVTGPGLNAPDVAAGSMLIVPLVLLAGDNRFDFAVSGTGTNTWALLGSITAVPLPGAAWLFISALGGLIVIGRRRLQVSVAHQ